MMSGLAHHEWLGQGPGKEKDEKVRGEEVWGEAGG